MEAEKKTSGALIGLIIIIILLILGGIYLWQKNLNKATAPSGSEQVGESSADQDTANLEADVNSIDVESLDSDL